MNICKLLGESLQEASTPSYFTSGIRLGLAVLCADSLCKVILVLKDQVTLTTENL